jgi:hypothetical protein
MCASLVFSFLFDLAWPSHVRASKGLRLAQHIVRVIIISIKSLETSQLISIDRSRIDILHTLYIHGPKQTWKLILWYSLLLRVNLFEQFLCGDHFCIVKRWYHLIRSAPHSWGYSHNFWDNFCFSNLRFKWPYIFFILWYSWLNDIFLVNNDRIWALFFGFAYTSKGLALLWFSIVSIS